jgi:Indole-3-glycerol phosphate synthase
MFLDDIVAYKLKQIEQEKKERTLNEIINLIKSEKSRDFKSALAKEKISIIAEIKKASPSKGIIKEDFDHKAIAEIYSMLDIDAISVLTEKRFFLGNDNYIKDVKEIAEKPVLRKDFIIDEYQIYQAKAIGADAILLIAAILKGKLKSFYDLAVELGLHVLVEVHTKEELEETLQTGAEIIGINNRNLKTFKVDLKTTEELIKYIPPNKIVVSESGITDSSDVNYLHSIGVKAVLIGETFMRGIDKLESMKLFVEKCKNGV